MPVISNFGPGNLLKPIPHSVFQALRHGLAHLVNYQSYINQTRGFFRHRKHVSVRGVPVCDWHSLQCLLPGSILTDGRMADRGRLEELIKHIACQAWFTHALAWELWQAQVNGFPREIGCWLIGKQKALTLQVALSQNFTATLQPQCLAHTDRANQSIWTNTDDLKP